MVARLMARICQTPFPDDLPRMWYQRLMARSFGQVREDNRPGRTSSVFIDCRIDGKRFKLIGPRSRGGHVMPFRDIATATVVLGEIRADIRDGKSPLQACAEFLPTHAGEVSVRFHYKRFLEAKTRQGSGNSRERQLSEQRL